MPLITTTITPFTHTPSRQNPATFSEDMDYRLSEENSRITQMNNLGTQMNSVADLVNTIETNLNLVANDLTNIDTVATNITKVNTVSTNITKVSNLDTNMTKITNLDTNMAKIANVDNNMSKVSNLDTNMTAITTVNTNIADINSVADDIANVNIVAENIGSITSKIGVTDIHNSTSKTTPVDADELPLLDSTSSFSLKKLTWANLKATLGAIFAPLVSPALTGTPTVNGVAFSGYVGFKNIIINGDMRVNQRNFNGDWTGASAYQYGYDRWFKNGTLKGQVVEDINYKKSTVYTLSGVGLTTTQITSPANGNWTISVPFNATNIQLEEGSVATPFEQRPYGLELSLCQRYYEKTEANRLRITPPGSGGLFFPIYFKVKKRVTPTISLVGIDSANSVSVDGFSAVFNSTTTFDVGILYTASAEL